MNLSKKEFFTGPTLTCSCTTTLWGFSPEKIDEYRDSLKRILSVNSKNRDILVDLTWDFDRVKLNSRRLYRSFVVVKTETSTHRICLLYPNTGRESGSSSSSSTGRGVLFTACSPHVMTCLNEYLTKTFDCLLKPLKLSGKFMLQVFEDYLMQTLSEDRLQGFSQLVYTVATENNRTKKSSIKETEGEPALSRITLDLRPNDLRHIYSTLDGSMSLMNAINDYLEKHTTLRFNALSIARVYCAGFVLTKNARIRFYDRGIDEAELWGIIGEMFAISQQQLSS